MKQIVVRYGLLGGLIVAVVLAAGTIYCYNTGKFEGNMLVGFASMALSFSFVFVAIKQVRDRQGGGVISFGKAFKIGLYITLITSTIYVVTWLICYYFFIPDFMEQFTTYSLNKAKASGMSGVELAKETAKMKEYTEMYKSPLMIILFTYIEILPVGLLVSLIAAAILKKKGNNATSRVSFNS